MILILNVIGRVVLLEVDVINAERRELIEIYDTLSPQLRQQLVTLARVIDTTREIIMKEKYSKINKKIKTDTVEGEDE